MLKIALTGGIACGKSIVSKYFADRGIPVIDTDIISRQLVTPNSVALSEIIEIFGKNIIDQKNQLNRKLLRQIIFDSKPKRLQLENILHPKIYTQVNIQILKIQQSTQNYPYCIIVIPLLFETQSNYDFDRIVVVDCTQQQQIERLMSRDKISQSECQAIVDNQISSEQRLKKADDIIDNNHDIALLRTQLEQLHANYLMNNPINTE